MKEKNFIERIKEKFILDKHYLDALLNKNRKINRNQILESINTNTLSDVDSFDSCFSISDDEVAVPRS